jgi:hypothetical protein
VVTRRGEDVWVGHSGGTFGYSSSVLFSVADRVGAIVLSNGTAPISSLAPALLARALAQIPGEGPAAPTVVSPMVPTPMPLAFEDLVGLYSWEDVGELARVEWRDGRLAMLWGSSPASPGGSTRVLEPTEDPLRFVVRGGREAGEPCVFRRGDDGSVVGLTIRGWPLARLVAAR